MPGMGRGDTSGGKDGNSGSAGAFNDGLGLTTGKTWYGNVAFGPAGGVATGFASGSNGNYGNYRSPSGQSVSGYTTKGGFPTLGTPRPTGLSALPRPTQPPPVVPPVVRPPVVKPPVVQPPVTPPPAQRPPANLSYQYNYQYPPGYNYSNYMTNPTQRPSPYSGPLQGSTYNKNGNMGVSNGQLTPGRGAGGGYGGGTTRGW